MKSPIVIDITESHTEDQTMMQFVADNVPVVESEDHTMKLVEDFATCVLIGPRLE